MKRSSFNTISCLSLLALLGCFGSTACSGEEDNTDMVANEDADDEGDIERTQELYVGSTPILSDDGSLRYLYAVSSLDGTAEVDLRKAVEMDDAWVSGNADPFFYTATLFEPTIIQWSLDENNNFIKGPVISFANDGVGGTYSAGFAPVYAEDNTYFVNAVSGQVTIWNPKEMIILKTIEVDVSSPVDHDGPADLSPSMTIGVSENRILVTVFWNYQDNGWLEMGSYS